MRHPDGTTESRRPDTCACYVVECPAMPRDWMTRCKRHNLARTRRPQWGDIVAPPDLVELPDSMGSETCPHMVKEDP